jgi:hypothetical protein
MCESKGAGPMSGGDLDDTIFCMFFHARPIKWEFFCVAQKMRPSINIYAGPPRKVPSATSDPPSSS